MHDPLYVRQLQLGPAENFVYLVGPKSGDEVLVVDPAWEVPAIEAAVEEDGKRLVGAFISHSHFDHINGLPELLERHDLPVWVQARELARSRELQALGEAARPLGHGDPIQVGAMTMRALHTPGHTPGSQCLHAGGALISGDTLFVNGCGRCDLAGGDPEQMYHSIHDVLLRLPWSTRLYPGHDYADVPAATLEESRAMNPYLRFEALGDFAAYRMRRRG